MFQYLVYRKLRLNMKSNYISCISDVLSDSLEYVIVMMKVTSVCHVPISGTKRRTCNYFFDDILSHIDKQITAQ